MSTSIRPESQAPSHLASHDLVTVLTVDREPHFRPRSPLDVPRNPRQVGGVLVRRMTLGELIERNEEAMAKEGRFWYLAAELLETASDGRTIRGRSELGPSTAGDNCGIGREQTVVATAAGNGDARGSISASALKLLDRVSAELTKAVYDLAEQFAVKRAGDDAVVEPADIRHAAEVVADTGTRRRLRSIATENGNGRPSSDSGSSGSSRSPAPIAAVPRGNVAGFAGTVPLRVTDQAGRELPATIAVVVHVPERSEGGA